MQRRFYLKPGQGGPPGTTSHAMPDGGIVWIGDKWAWPEIKSHEASPAEVAEYEAYLKYMQSDLSRLQPVDFAVYLNSAALATKIDETKAALDAAVTARAVK